MSGLRTWATPVLAVANVALVLSGALELRQAVAVVVALELLLVLSAAGTAAAAVRAYRHGTAGGATTWQAFLTAVRTALPRPVAAVVVAELTTVRSLWLAARRRDDGVGPGDRAHGYADGLGLTTGALTAVAAVELALVHVLVPWPAVRAGLLVAGVWTLVAVLGMWAGQRRYPHVVTPQGLRLRAGPAVQVEVPWSAVAAVRRTALHEPWAVAVVGRRLHLPVHGSTTLLAELHEPVTARLRLGRTAEVDSIAFSADDVRGLLADCSRVLLREDDPSGLPT